MPIADDQLSEYPHSRFHKPGEATVYVGPYEAMEWKKPKIPLDGRHYECGGKIILKNGRELSAHLAIQTHTFDFLEREKVLCKLDRTWYSFDEPELFAALGITREDALPYTWLADPPLDYHEKGPYPMYDTSASAEVRSP